MISLDKNSKTPAYVQIYEALRSDIAHGSYAADMRLPSVRYLAEELSVSRNTVDKAYQQLFAEGYVIGKDRSGFFVDPHVLEFADFGCDDVANPSPIQASKPKPSVKIPYDFFYSGLPDSLLPRELLRKAATEALCELRGANDYSDPFGLPELREPLCHHLHRTRSVQCSAEQIAVQAGTRDGLGRLLNLFDPACDVIAIEQPGYLGIAQVARNGHFKVAPLNASSPEAFFKDLEQSHAKIVFVTPSHQFPTGRIMSYADRLRLIEWACRTNGYIIEDDYDSEYRYQVMPIPSLQSLDRFGRVIYSGTFSKVFSPGVRTSYLVLPERLVPLYRERMGSFWCSVPWLIQKALAILLEEGSCERHMRKQVKHFRTSQSLLIGALRSQLSSVVSIEGEGAGLHLWLRIKDGRTNHELVALALEKGVKVYVGDPYWLDRSQADPSMLLMGYSAIPQEDIEPGVRLLKQAWVG